MEGRGLRKKYIQVAMAELNRQGTSLSELLQAARGVHRNLLLKELNATGDYLELKSGSELFLELCKLSRQGTELFIRSIGERIADAELAHLGQDRLTPHPLAQRPSIAERCRALPGTFCFPFNPKEVQCEPVFGPTTIRLQFDILTDLPISDWLCTHVEGVLIGLLRASAPIGEYSVLKHSAGRTSSVLLRAAEMQYRHPSEDSQTTSEKPLPSSPTSPAQASSFERSYSDSGHSERSYSERSHLALPTAERPRSTPPPPSVSMEVESILSRLPRSASQLRAAATSPSTAAEASGHWAAPQAPTSNEWLKSRSNSETLASGTRQRSEDGEKNSSATSHEARLATASTLTDMDSAVAWRIPPKR